MVGHVGCLVENKRHEIAHEARLERYGLDFGYKHPLALVQVRIKDGDLYVRELLYKTYLHSAELVAEFKNLIPQSPRSPLSLGRGGAQYEERENPCDSPLPKEEVPQLIEGWS